MNIYKNSSGHQVFIPDGATLIPCPSCGGKSIRVGYRDEFSLINPGDMPIVTYCEMCSGSGKLVSMPAPSLSERFITLCQSEKFAGGINGEPTHQGKIFVCGNGLGFEMEFHNGATWCSVASPTIEGLIEKAEQAFKL